MAACKCFCTRTLPLPYSLAGCYEVFDSPNGGKGLRATRVTIPNASTAISFGPTADHVLTSPQIIPQGQLIFEDLVPHVWYCTPDSAGVCCCACGKVRQFNILYPSVAKFLENSRVFCKLLVLSKHTVQPCENESCSVSFCSPACSAAAPEHAFMCGSNGNVLQFAAHLESLRQTHQAQMSHLLGLALVAYAKIAIIFIQSRSRSPGAASESDHSPESSGRQFLLGYQTSDFCKIVHATRTHSLSYSKTLFEEIIAPAYYDAHLRAPLTTIRSIFESHQPWRGTAQQASFVKSELFSPVFFRNLIGCFSTNTLEVIVDGSIRGSALFCIFSKMNHACRKNTANVDCEAASVQVVASQVIECGEEITTTYRFDESGCQSAAAAYIARKRALDQYLFR
jgi:hypothetical protein